MSQSRKQSVKPSKVAMEPRKGDKSSAGRSSKAAVSAARVLKDPKASKDARQAAASALSTLGRAETTTSSRAAAAAAKVLKDPKASKDAKIAAASALTQWPTTKPKKLSRGQILEAVQAQSLMKEKAS